MKRAAKPVNKPLAPPPTTPEARQEQCIALAYDLVEQRLRDGTATSQETTYFLKLASSKEMLEMERQRQEIKLAEAKIKALEAEQNREIMFQRVVDAIRSYQGVSDEEDL